MVKYAPTCFEPNCNSLVYTVDTLHKNTIEAVKNYSYIVYIYRDIPLWYKIYIGFTDLELKYILIWRISQNVMVYPP